MKINNRFIAGLLILLCTAAVYGETKVSCSFQKGKWNSNNWQLVKSPRWDYFGKWIQRDGYIENATPTGVTAKQMQSKKAAETYTSMVLKEKMGFNTTIESTMEFDYQMAPLIVIAPELGKDKQGRPEYREHFEIVLFDKGVNIWHHTYANGKPSWTKAAWFRLPLKAKQKYRMKVVLKKSSRGKTMKVFIDGKEIGGYTDNSLPDTFYVGITGCEGVNRFYDFSAYANGKKKKPAVKISLAPMFWLKNLRLLFI